MKDTIPRTKYDHMFGSLVTFNSKLTVISGSGSLENVEIFEHESGQWNVSSIHMAPEKLSNTFKQLALVVNENGTDTLFFFGGFTFFNMLFNY